MEWRHRAYNSDYKYGIHAVEYRFYFGSAQQIENNLTIANKIVIKTCKKNKKMER